METLFDDLIKRQCELVNAVEKDRCIFEVRGDDETNAIWFHLRPVGQLNGRVVLDKLCKTLNSNQSFCAGVLHLNFIHVPSVRGSGRDTRHHETKESWIERYCKTGSIYDPKNENDNMCLARCIAFLQLYNSAKNRSAVYHLRKPNSSDVYNLALKLCKSANVSPNQECGYDEIVKFQLILRERLVVFLDKECKEFIFCGSQFNDNGDERNVLFILQDRNHFYGVVRIKAVLNATYFCLSCLKGGKGQKYNHRCDLSCKRCDGGTLHTETPLKVCGACKRYFAGDACFQEHLKIRGSGKSTCDIKKYCTTCRKFYVLDGKTKMAKHRCNWKICKYCKRYLHNSHECHMVEWNEKVKAKDTRYLKIYFDIEARQDDSYDGRDNWKEHKPNLLICQQVCDDCEKDNNIENDCSTCGKREHIFQGFYKDSNVVKDFLDYLTQLHSERKTHITLFAHNFKSYDGFFLTQELLAKNITPEVKLAGAKILSLKTKGMHFKCSLSFLPQRLSSLPKAFGLKELKKGHFCHMANNEDWYEYSGPMPPKDLYCCSTLSDKDLVEFNKWYDEQVASDYLFNFKDEIIAYCRSDVQILREAMQTFKELFMESAGFDPLFNCITLSAACMANFRRNHLGNSEIGIVPRGGYRGRDKASFEALKWLSYEEHVLGKKITHAENSREVVILNNKVDGYVEITKEDGSIEKRIYQFAGCYWHLCRKCIPDEESRTRIRGKNNVDPYENTKKITKMYRDAGYVVIEKWECDFKKDLLENTDVIEFFKNHPFKRVAPLNLRDALYGGRTSALYTEYVADLKKGEKICLFDVISEYPAQMMHKEYCYSHATPYVEGDPEMPKLKDMNGVIKATILPPTDLFIPVLPYKCCNKLLFPLCKTCAETSNQDGCNHTDEERMILGTWPVPEVKVAVEKGYVIKAIHECYQYPGVKKFNPQTKEDGIFSSYIRQNMAMKLHASGFPNDVVTEEQKDLFIKMHYDRDGIVLDKSKFEKNPGKRTLAKLILNSF
ncbi:uncharacterized protein LOC113215208, partial [Frankliniella occidentalis]|uniref:DNA-directed DNA polymerase n=1 Tax=Frankliniella occidentalis TaxID=133901 RepID=A0A9C6XD83_FRAOC